METLHSRTFRHGRAYHGLVLENLIEIGETMKMVIRQMKRFELENALDMVNVSYHSKTRMYRVNAVNRPLGKCFAGFVVRDERGIADHFITNTGIVLIRGHENNMLITIKIPTANSASDYWKQLDRKAPSFLIKEVKKNRSVYTAWERAHGLQY